MSRLVDNTVCPDCRGQLDFAATCTACGLRITGPLASELWRRMVAADQVVEQLRVLGSQEQQVPVPATSPDTSPARAALDQAPPFPAPAPTRAPERRLPAASVPVVLLSLGAVCLLVASVVFVAVAWGSLGLTGRTLVLLGVTTFLAVVAAAVTRRGLPVAAEAFWLLVAGMLTVDLLGAHSAGVGGLDALDWRGTGLLVGTALFCLGLAVGAWALAEPVGRLVGVEAVAVIGAVVVCLTNVWTADERALLCTVALPVLAGLFVLLRRTLPVSAYGVG